jgi:hypothetical protein
MKQVVLKPYTITLVAAITLMTLGLMWVIWQVERSKQATIHNRMIATDFIGRANEISKERNDLLRDVDERLKRVEKALGK